MRLQPQPAQPPEAAPMDSSAYQHHAVFMRKLKRLRHAMDVAQDPADFFEATSDYINAIGVIGDNALTSAFAQSNNTHVALACDAAQCRVRTAPGDQRRSEGQRPEDNLLAATLHSALTAPILRASSSPAAADPLACLGGAVLEGSSKPTDCSQRSGSTHQHASLISNSSSMTVATIQPLQRSYSLPQYIGSPSTDASGGGTSAGTLPRSNSAVQSGVSSRDLSHLQHAARLSHTCTQAQNAQHPHHHLQPAVSDKDSLYSLLCQQLRASAKPCVKEPGSKAPVQQCAAPSQRRQQQLNADSDERKALLLRRLKQAMAWSSAQRCRNTGKVHP